MGRIASSDPHGPSAAILTPPRHASRQPSFPFHLTEGQAARLGAAVADERQWRTSHPENGAWRAWVSDGFQALYGGEPKQGAKPAGGVVHVRAYVRNGQPVAAHTRGAPPSASGRDDRPGPEARDAGAETPGLGVGGYRGVVLRRRNLLEDSVIIPAMAKRPERRHPGGRRRRW